MSMEKMSTRPTEKMSGEDVKHQSLKRSRAGHLSYISRLYREIEALMLNHENRDQVLVKSEQLTTAFEHFEVAHAEYISSMTDPREVEAVCDTHRQQMVGYTEFEERLNDWLGYNKESSVGASASQIGKSVSNKTTGSKRSSSSSTKLKEAVVRKQVAQLKLKQLEERQQLEKQRQELQRQEDILCLKGAVDEAELETRLWQDQIGQEEDDLSLLFDSRGILVTRSDVGRLDNNDSSPDHAHSVGKSKSIPRKSNDDNSQIRHSTQRKSDIYRDRYSGSQHLDTGQHDSRFDTRTLNSGDSGYRAARQHRPQFQYQTECPHLPNKLNPGESSYPHFGNFPPGHQGISPPVQMPLSQLTEQQFMQQQQILNAMFYMPRPEIATFDGNSKNYWKFINNFTTNVASKLCDDRLKLSYLIQHCTGEAKEAIEDCVILPVDQGFGKACDILHRKYGRPHVVARAYIEELVNGPPVKGSEGLSKLSTQMQKCELTLSQMQYEADLNNSDNLLKITRRLPVHVRSKWIDRADALIESGIEPNFSHLTQFVEQKARAANTMYGQDMNSQSKTQSIKPATSNPKTNNTTNNPKVTTLATHADNWKENIKPVCPMCSKNHMLNQCGEFKKLAVQDRLQVIRKEKLCDNCFILGHYAVGCMRKGACEICQRKHHSLLHSETPNRTRQPAATSQNTSQTSRQPVATNQVPPQNIPPTRNAPLPQSMPQAPVGQGQCSATGAGQSRVCLRVLPVEVQGPDSSCTIKTYALLDEGSDISLCKKSLLENLNVKGVRKDLSITTVNQSAQMNRSEVVSLTIRSLDGGESVELEKVWSIDSLPVSPQCIIRDDDKSRWPHLADVTISEIEEKEVGLLIGSDIPEAFWVLEERRGNKKEPYALRSLLGWTILGPSGGGYSSCYQSHVNFAQSDDLELARQLEMFWKADFPDLVPESIAMSVEDRRALRIMESTVIFLDGHYHLALPWKQEPPMLPNNRPMAESRLKYLKGRLKKDENLKEKYEATINDYVSKGYARKIPEEELESEIKWYLPHHPVFHPQKPGKVRVVFDCAARFRGFSLNDKLLQGPDLTNYLLGVLIRFREEPVAVMADIEAMFHQVKVRPSDCNALRFLWWDNGDLNSEPQEYQMLVHLFGATSSPSCASFGLRKTAVDNKDGYDADVIDSVTRNFYVDDFLKSLKSHKEACALIPQICELLSKGGFHLTKWISNSREVLCSVSEAERAKSVVSLDLEHLPVERALGVKWDVEKDQLRFVPVDRDKPATRRGILSVVSSMYDPLGIAAPVILPAKILLQRLCKNKLEWDTELDNSEKENWNVWLRNIMNLEKVVVPRCIKPEGFGDIASAQIHHFADACEFAYGAVSYIRLVNADGEVNCAFLLGKSRVAPIKAVTIPRLELSAAVLAVKQDKLIRDELETPVQLSVFWTDSTSVLRYISCESRRFKTFVANRLTVIQENSLPSQWRYVPSGENPADYASRGMKASDSYQFYVWLNGPAFLWENDSCWPEMPVNFPSLSNDDVEQKKVAKVHNVNKETGLDAILVRYSKWVKLQRALAWLLRYKQYCCSRYLGKNFSDPCIGEFTVKELQNATTCIVKYVQLKVFPHEVTILSAVGQKSEAGTALKSRSALVKLCPIMLEGVLCVGGRLSKADIDYSAKHPIILPYSHHVTDLIIQHYHEMHVGHSGPDILLAALRQSYWVVKGRSAVRRVVQRCLKCRRRDAPRGEQLMASLPEARVTSEKPPFTYTGVDYFGPLIVKQGRKTAKRYGCLFTCLTTRAVHIEVAHSLEQDSFLAALLRFTARRGKPEQVFSDNGTNFRAGEKELHEHLQAWNQHILTQAIHQAGIEWHFNPPAASHMGGAWERLIRSTRRILRSLLEEQLVSDETLLTLMAEVERILNDRPLTPVSEDPCGLDPLTPSKLLLLKPNKCLPSGVFEKDSMYVKRWWRQAQYMANIFWRRWITEYLPLLQARQKWCISRRNFQVNDLVLVVDEQLPRGQWPLGIVQETYPGDDGLVRSVLVQMASSSKVRPITKLCFLECFPEDDVVNGGQTVSDEKHPKLESRDSKPRRSTRSCKPPVKLKDYSMS